MGVEEIGVLESIDRELYKKARELELDVQVSGFQR